MSTAAHRVFKNRLYAQYARIGKALGNAHRLELLELLAQGPRTVESLAAESGLSVANASQHLRALHAAGLVETTRHGVFIEYRLADDRVFELSRAIRTTAERRLSDLERLVRVEFARRVDGLQPVSMEELLARAKRDDVIVLDTRPAQEYAAGHIAGALSIPVDELHRRLRRLRRDREYVAYCRGPYCVYADHAVELLRKSGRHARRLAEGFPEWRAAGLPVETGAARATTGARS
jgi:rhodanese-related sulfurtransferase/DNA-binding transcriptional ArsR family regulator